MKKINPGQEILLLTNSSLAQRELCADDFSPNNKTNSLAEKLEEACWNGLLNEWLPGVMAKGKKQKDMFLWQINVANKFLCVQLAKAPLSTDHYYSLDPYLFLPEQNIN
jgi:hypothetical protein